MKQRIHSNEYFILGVLAKEAEKFPETPYMPASEIQKKLYINHRVILNRGEIETHLVTLKAARKVKVNGNEAYCHA